MDIRMRIFIGIIMVLAFIYVCTAIKRRVIDIRHALVWLVVCILLLILDIFPALLEGISKLLGFALPVNMLFFLGFLLAIVIIFGLSAKVSKLNEQVKQMTQDLALLKNELEEKTKS